MRPIIRAPYKFRESDPCPGLAIRAISTIVRNSTDGKAGTDENQ